MDTFKYTVRYIIDVCTFSENVIFNTTIFILYIIIKKKYLPRLIILHKFYRISYHNFFYNNGQVEDKQYFNSSNAKPIKD